MGYPSPAPILHLPSLAVSHLPSPKLELSTFVLLSLETDLEKCATLIRIWNLDPWLTVPVLYQLSYQVQPLIKNYYTLFLNRLPYRAPTPTTFKTCLQLLPYQPRYHTSPPPFLKLYDQLFFSESFLTIRGALSVDYMYLLTWIKHIYDLSTWVQIRVLVCSMQRHLLHICDKKGLGALVVYFGVVLTVTNSHKT